MTDYKLHREVLPARSLLDRIKTVTTLASVIFVTGVSFAVTIVVVGSTAPPEPICVSYPKLYEAVVADYSMSELEDMVDSHRFDVDCDP